ncbi:hypothetical protein [Streptomyces arboris]|uniref:hypothetical protein n=1 Tax=Streptomyces arboris TaxID=2600619 RepID=UPI003BF51086
MGWIAPATGAFTEGNAPADAGPCSLGCCSPSITSATLCTEDGTSILVIVRSGCVDCADDPTDPVVVGWCDLTTGVYTAGPAPAGSGPCESGCIDTVCRQLCDDADGDGEADTTYSELWCIRADGSAELVLTYRDDPSVPYTPLAPVDCTYGCPETETVTLCDDVGPFLRRYTWLQGIASFEDFALDGVTAHVVTGTVGVCDTGEPCEAQSTPAATLGLCLADGTPIAVVVTRDCTGTVTQDGWINLTTGVYSAGGPPVGTMACGNPRSITTAGTFCDVDPDTGAVLGLVLIEYTYGADGAVDAVRLVDAVTGTTYTPQGEVTTCPAGVEQPERDLVQLCDTTPDGTVTAFVRDYARDEGGAITGHADYDLDGAAYTVTGTVDRCADDCQSCETVVLCDLPASASTAPILDPASTGNSGNRTGTAANGVGWSTIGGRAGSDPANWWAVSLFPAPSGTFTLTLTRPVAVTWGVRLGAAPVVGTLGSLTMPVGSVPTYVHPLHTWNPATRTLTAMPGSNVSNVAHTSTFAHAGPISTLQFTGPAGGPLSTSRKVGDFRITPVEQPFLRRTCRDCDGQTVTTTDTRLDGATPYVPTGTVGVCSGAPDEQCVPLALGEVCYSPALTSATLSLGTAVDGTWQQATSGTTPVSDPSTLTYAPAPVGPAVSTAGVGPVTGQVRPGLGTALGDLVLGFSYLRRQFTTTSAITAVALAATADDRPHRIWLDGVVVADFSVTPGSPSLTDPTAYNQSWSPVTTTAVSLPAGAHTLYYEWASHGGVTREWGALDIRLTLAERAPSARAQVVQHCDGTTNLIDIETGLTVPATSTVVTCPTGKDGSDEPCRDSSSTLLCDTAAQEAVTVLDPGNRPGADGWEIVSYTGYGAGYGPEATIPYPVPHPAGNPNYMGVRSDLTVGPGPGYSSYETAPVRWVMRKTFTAPEDGIAVVSSANFRGDGGARVRINGLDAGMYGQWNLPATSGTAQIPVTAGPNTVEVEVRDGAGQNYIMGRLDIVMTATVQFMRRTVVDCTTGETVAVVDTTLDGEPYEVTGVVGQCEPVAECCEQAPPEQRVDVETTLLCVRDQATGDIVGQVIAERVYDDQSGDLIEQRLTDLDGEPYALPAGAELGKCPSPDRITRQVCVVESGITEFLTNAANATTGVDSDWQWSPNLGGTWYPMYRVAPHPAWTVTDTAPNQAHWVGPHVDRTVCPTAGETSPPVPATWYTRASWNLPQDVTPESIRIAATVLNADNDVVQWRLNNSAWQPVGTAGLSGAAWTFPPTAVPGGRAGQNEIVVQLFEGQPGVNCPSPNSAGMILHVIATYDHAPQVWTQVIEPGGQTYYLDENGDRQEAIPAGTRLVACGGGGDAPCCPPEQRMDVELQPMCVLDNATGNFIQRVLAEVVYDTATGDRLGVHYVDPVTWGPVALPGGTHLDVCPEGATESAPDVEVVQLCDLVDGADPVPFLRHLAYLPGATAPTVVDTALDGVTPYALTGTAGACSTPCDVQSVIEACRCDDTNGDGLPDVGYVELLAVDCGGVLTSIGTYTRGLTEPYSPVAPVDCEESGNHEGAEPAFGVQARRVELAAGASWNASAWPTLQSVTAVAHGGTGTVTTTDGTSTLHTGEAATWSVGRDVDAALTGPLTITAETGTVTLSYTIGVTL